MIVFFGAACTCVFAGLLWDFEAVLAFKLCRIQGMLESLDKEMSGCVEAKDELRLMELIKQKQDLDRHKVFLCGMLRRVV